MGLDYYKMWKDSEKTINQHRQENEQLKAELTEAEGAVADLMELNDKLDQSSSPLDSMPTQFVMKIEPHTPANPEKPCHECVLQHGPMCMDRSYCRVKETGKTWRKRV